MNLKVTPTALKAWFQYRCERKFVYETMDTELRARLPVHEQAVTSAWMGEGNKSESAATLPTLGFRCGKPV